MPARHSTKTANVQHTPLEIYSQQDRFTAPASARGALPSWVLGMTLAGSVIHDADSRRVFSRAGDCVLVRALYPQYWRVATSDEGGEGHWKVIYAVFTPRPHWYPWLLAAGTEGLLAFRCSDARTRGRVRRSLKRVLAHSRAAHPHRIEFAMHALEAALLLCWRDQWQGEPSAQLDPRIMKAIELLTQDSRQPQKLAQLARRCHLSRSHLASLFRKQVGSTPLQYQERHRIENAQRMLRMSFEPVRQIAFKCGFEDVRYFSTRFKKHTGVTPRDFRNASRMPG